MNSRYTRIMLTVIALLLAVIAIREFEKPPSVQAQTNGFYVEPGVTILRRLDGLQQAKGKVMINMNTGEIWGFPTLSDLPYPVDLNTGRKGAVSKAFYLGQFDFTSMHR
jgi:hypothetical protein